MLCIRCTVRGISLRAQSGDSPLHKAAIFGSASCARALLEAGASPNSRNKARRLTKIMTHCDCACVL